MFSYWALAFHCLFMTYVLQLYISICDQTICYVSINHSDSVQDVKVFLDSTLHLSHNISYIYYIE
jgi:hypothetical protein